MFLNVFFAFFTLKKSINIFLHFLLLKHKTLPHSCASEPPPMMLLTSLIRNNYTRLKHSNTVKLFLKVKMQKNIKTPNLKKVENVKKIKMQKVFAPDMSTWLLVMVLNNNYVDYKLTNFELMSNV